jgi:sporulation protein YqfC
VTGVPKGVRLGRRLAELLEIPQDIVLDLPRLTLVGNLQLVLENHRGIIEYAPEKLRLALGQGELTITGIDLVLVSLSAEEAVIEGHIAKVEFS